MRHLAILVLLASFVPPVYAQTAQAQLLVPLTTEDGKRAPNLTPADVKVAESGKLLKVLKVEARDSPVRVTLQIENSRGLSDNFVLIRQGAKAFINAMPAGVQITLVNTAPVARTVVKPTSDHAELLKGIDAISPDSGPGRFIESLVEWVERVDKDKDKSYTPVLVTLGATFGDEQVRDSDIKNAMNKLPTLGAKVYGIMYNNQSNQGGTADAQISIGKQATQRTGGRWELVSNVQGMAAALPEYGAEVAKLQVGGQYLLSVEWPNGTTPPANMALAIEAPSGVTVGRITLLNQRK
jgi:hypothetical protein